MSTEDSSYIPDPNRFPCRVYVKVLGAQTIRFEALAQRIVSHHVEAPDLHAVSRRLSRTGRYLALTFTVTARSRAQLDGLYRELSENKSILVAL
ncbi:MAG: YbeD family protein [Acidiferrobacteraceae bacterium]